MTANSLGNIPDGLFMNTYSQNTSVYGHSWYEDKFKQSCICVANLSDFQVQYNCFSTKI